MPLVGVSSFNLTDTDIAEHHEGKLIVQLKADRTSLGALRIARAFGRQFAVQLHADELVTRFDIEIVPLRPLLQTSLTCREQIDAARGILRAIVVDDLDLVTDVGRRSFERSRRRRWVVRSADHVMPAGNIADRYSAVALRRNKVLD